MYYQTNLTAKVHNHSFRYLFHLLFSLLHRLISANDRFALVNLNIQTQQGHIAALGRNRDLIDIPKVLTIGLKADGIGRSAVERNSHILDDPCGPRAG